MTKYYIDNQGNYLGGYDGPDEGNPYSNKTEVPSPPPISAMQKYLNGNWQAPAQTPNLYPDKSVIVDRATGEPYEVFVENGVLTSEPLGESNG